MKNEKFTPIQISPEEIFQELPLSEKDINKRYWIFFTTYNRLSEAQIAFVSLVNQNLQELVIIVSDNSTDLKFKTWLFSQNWPRKFFYVNWSPTLAPPYDHARKIFEIVKFHKPEFWQMFHDDDYALPYMCEKLMNELKGDPGLYAVCGNAVIISKSAPSKLMHLESSGTRELQFRNPTEFVEKYFLPTSGVAPFPGYLYRKNCAEVFCKELHGRKYVDIWLLSRVFKLGSLKWLPEPLMLYRTHSQQDSSLHSVHDKFSLFNSLVKKGELKKSGSLYAWFFVQNFKHHLKRMKWNTSKFCLVKRLLVTKQGQLFLFNFLRCVVVPKIILGLLKNKLGFFEFRRCNYDQAIDEHVERALRN